MLQNFRDQRIDGSGLPLLTEEHLTTIMSMKLGPALKLRSILAKKLGSCNVCLHCSHCHNSTPSPDGGNNSGNLSDSGGGNSWFYQGIYLNLIHWNRDGKFNKLIFQMTYAMIKSWTDYKICAKDHVNVLHVL